MDQVIHCIGQAHLDPIWLWRWQEGCGEVLQTFRSALDRMKETPDFVFTCSSAAYYRWVEEIDPDMFAEITARIREGRWVPVNGWWVQPDCNMPSGESYARHALYSQLYYYEKFGRICRTGYNVDSFGHNAMLPQMIKKSGMDAYVMMRPGSHENGEIPQGVFLWESPDGTQIPVFRIRETYCGSGPEFLQRAAALSATDAEEQGHDTMLFYGVGNHGGGPTRRDIAWLSDKKEEAGKKLVFSSPDAYFEVLRRQGLESLPVWRDEMQHHASGCYSATSLVKALNRAAENRLADAEVWNTAAARFAGMPAGTAELAEAWRDVCFNQFHDILCGCSIREAYEDAKEVTGHALTIAARMENNALLRLARRIDTWVEGVADPPETEVRHQSGNGFATPVVVFNPLLWDVKMAVSAYHRSALVTDEAGRLVPFQNIRSSRLNDDHTDTLFWADVPAMGYAVYWLTGGEGENRTPSMVHIYEEAGAVVLENSRLRAVFDPKAGGLSSLRDTAGVEFLTAPSVPLVIDDHKTDTWAHNVFRFHDVAGQMELVSLDISEEGPLRAAVRLQYRYGTSTLTQEYSLTGNEGLLRVTNKVLWQEPFTMLKFPFAAAGSEPEASYEIPCGFLRRPCNGEEEPALGWADLSVVGGDGLRRGLTVLSDSKYSWDCPSTEKGAVLRLTGLRNVIFADHFSHRPWKTYDFTDEGLQRFEYALMPHTGSVEGAGAARAAVLFHRRPVTVPESYHRGAGAPQRNGFLRCDAENVVPTAVKFCEDGSGALILRAYEAAGHGCRASFEGSLLPCPVTVSFGSFECKTLRIEEDGTVREVDFLEGCVS